MNIADNLLDRMTTLINDEQAVVDDQRAWLANAPALPDEEPVANARTDFALQPSDAGLRSAGIVPDVTCPPPPLLAEAEQKFREGVIGGEGPLNGYLEIAEPRTPWWRRWLHRG